MVLCTANNKSKPAAERAGRALCCSTSCNLAGRHSSKCEGPAYGGVQQHIEAPELSPRELQLACRGQRSLRSTGWSHMSARHTGTV